MLFMATKNLQENMILGNPILHPKGGVILEKGEVLTSSRIKRLQDLEIDFIYVQDPRFPDLSSNWVVREDLYQKSVQELEHLFEVAEKKAHPLLFADMQDISKIFRDILKNFFAIPTDAVMHFCNAQRICDDFFEHSVRVAMISLSMGRKLGLGYTQMYNLGLGALLHDIGKSALPKEILDPRATLSEEEKHLFQMHPHTGWDLLQGQEAIWPTARTTVLQHHELWDGSGYPRGISGEEIHLFPSMVCVANAYETMKTFCSETRRSYAPHEAYRHIRDNQGVLYNPQAVKLFMATVAPYPPGTWVRFTTGYMGKVVSTSQEGITTVRCTSHQRFGKLKNSIAILFSETAPAHSVLSAQVEEVYQEEPIEKE